MVAFSRRRQLTRRFISIAALLAILAATGHSARASELPSVHKRQGLEPGPAATPSPSGAVRLQPPAIQQHFETDANKVSETLANLIREAIARNPNLRASREETSAATHRISPAGMPEDPYVGYRMKDLPTTFSMTSENATEKQTEIQQRYPFPGKLAFREKIAAQDAAASRERMHAAQAHLVEQVKSAFADVFLVDKDIEIALERQRRLRDLVDIATSKYKVGPGLQQDVLNADVALARLDSTLIELARKRRTREIRFATLLNQDEVAIPPLGVLPGVSLERSVSELEQMVLETNPDIRERDRVVQRDESALRLAQMAPLPDLVFYVAYGSRYDQPNTGTPPGVKKGAVRPDLMTGQIMLDFPIFYYWKQREQLHEAEDDLRRSRALREGARRQAIDALHDLLARLSQHEQVAASFQTEVIPVAQAAVSASVSAYQVNRVDFLTLLAAQDNLDNYQTEYWSNESERFRDLADIDEVTGAALTADGWSR